MRDASYTMLFRRHEVGGLEGGANNYCHASLEIMGGYNTPYTMVEIAA